MQSVDVEKTNGDARAGSLSKRDGTSSVGGQAVIEGVMMRSMNRISIAVRQPDGNITTKGWDFIPLGKRIKMLGIPIIRGSINLGEMLYWGLKTLDISAKISTGANIESPSKGTKLISALTLLLGLGLGIVLFVYLPLLIATVFGFRERPVEFNIVAGIIRSLIFLSYLFLISLMPDVKRLFQYHGAEHRTIHAFEKGEPLVVERVQKYSTFHPRCGTSFILIVAVVAIVLFAGLDAAIYLIWGFAPKPLLRMPFHLAFLPVIAGVSYEVLKLSEKLSKKSVFGKSLVAPGLWMQKITTRPPENDMVEVAISALLDSVQNISIAR